MAQAPQNNPEAWERFMKEREDFYKGREAIAERLVAKKYGLSVETIRAIDEEWGEKPMERRTKGMWKPSETPVLFDRDEANRAVAEHSMVPLTPQEKTREERQRLIDRRKAKRAAGQAPAAKEAMAPEPTPPANSGAIGGSVHVRGYYRREGTYVQPHTRSAPRR
jgi:hypothetical protein